MRAPPKYLRGRPRDHLMSMESSSRNRRKARLRERSTVVKRIFEMLLRRDDLDFLTIRVRESRPWGRNVIVKTIFRDAT